MPDRLNGYLSVTNFRSDNQMFSVSHIIQTESNILYLLLSCTGVKCAKIIKFLHSFNKIFIYDLTCILSRVRVSYARTDLFNEK